MNIFKKIYCRIYQFLFRLIMPFLPYKNPKTIDSIDGILEILNEKQIKSVLLVTDTGIRSFGITNQLEQLLTHNNIYVSIYDKTCANPTVNNVEEARKQYLKDKCESIIAFGGGSSMDCAKAVGVRIAYPKKTLNKLKGLLKVRKKIPLLFAIPTTAGTGSEVTLTSVITDSDSKHKYTINSFTLIPSFAVLDPKVTKTLPPSLTATTGMDALTHAIEAYIGKSTTKLTRKMSLKSTKLIFENIKVAYSDGENEQARKNMLQAAYYAGIAFSRSYVGYVHSVAHSLGGEYNIPHGLANAVILPVVLELYGKSIYKKLHKMAVYIGISNRDDDIKQSANKFINEIKMLNEKMKIPSKLEGIKEDDIEKMANHADCEANPLYPVPKLLSVKELEKIYYKILKR